MTEHVRVKPNWLRDAGLVSVSLPDAPIVQKYRGAQRLDCEEQYTQALSDSALDSLARAGVTLVWIPFFNGFGLEFEKAETERLREYIARVHARGFKAAASIQVGALVPETLMLEDSESQNWLQVNGNGQHPAVSSHGGFSLVRPCFNSESFLRYMERVCSLAVDCGADLVHFKSLGYNAEPDTCRCPICVSSYREFLKSQYGAQDERTKQAGKDRFGHNNFTHVRPPAAEDTAGSQDNPHLQEWTKFKVKSLSACLSRLALAVTKRNPECAVGADLMRGPDVNADAYGINYSEQLPQIDVVAIGGGHVNLNLVANRVRCLRVARVCGATIDSSSGGKLDLRIAINLALSERGLGGMGSATSAAFAPGWENRVETDASLNNLRGYIDFYHRHKGTLLQGARSLTAIGVYRDTPSRAFSGEKPQAWSGIEAELVNADVAFNPVFPNQLGNLSIHRCIIVAECESMSDEVVNAFERYVNAGGALVILGDAGSRDGWRRKRNAPALAALIGSEFPNASQRNIGDGRVIYVPAPSDAAKIAETIAVLSFARPWSVSAEGGSIVSQAVQTRGGALALHVVNVADENARNVRVSLACETAPQQVLPLSAEGNHEPVQFTYDNGRVNFSIESLRRYVLFQITQ
jgi:hypothetical protein